MAGSDRTAVDAAPAGGERVRIDARLWWDERGYLRLGEIFVGSVTRLAPHLFNAVVDSGVRLARFPTLAEARSAVEQAVREALAG